ncbi:uncharacterized protein BDV14DRAFT_118686 [Aspergillus stella-maris]|uniref:uncharacterized protein n=1 Tax=Aspergillus stella-maris TaxID=1810926 RepID=UPI003CCDD5A5
MRSIPGRYSSGSARCPYQIILVDDTTARQGVNVHRTYEDRIQGTFAPPGKYESRKGFGQFTRSYRSKFLCLTEYEYGYNEFDQFRFLAIVRAPVLRQRSLEWGVTCPRCGERNWREALRRRRLFTSDYLEKHLENDQCIESGQWWQAKDII